MTASSQIGVQARQAARTGGSLTPGMQLVYESGGAQTPWTVNSVARDTTLGGRTGCVRVRIRTSPDQLTAETRALCADAAMMYTWNAASGQHRASRPLGDGDSLTVPQRNGGNAFFSAGAPADSRSSHDSGGECRR